MPNLTAREMLARLPVRMAEGGALDAPGVSAAYRKAMETGGQQTVDDYYANLRRDAAAYLANPNAPTGADAYNVLVQSGISTSDLINAGVGQAVLDKIFTVQQPAGQTTATGQVVPAPAPAMRFTTPAGMTSAYERSPDLMNEARRLGDLGQNGRAALDAQGRQYVENLQQDGINAAERAQMLEYATERGYTFDDLLNAGVDPSVLFNRVAQKPKPYVSPNAGPTVYQPLPSQPDIYGAGQPALDVDFRNSAPRTAIPGMPGQFDYTPAAKLKPATGAGYTWTPPSVTSRPRSLLSPREIQAYGGLTSKSQQFAQNRAAIDRSLRALLDATPALKNTSTYNMLRNRIMSGEFGDAQRAFDPTTTEGQRLQALVSGLGTMTGGPAAVTGTVADSTAAGGYAEPIAPLTYGGFGFSQGGAVKKPEGFAEGGIATAGRIPLDPSDPRYITEDPRVSPDVQVPLDELLRQQMAAIDSAPTARVVSSEPEPDYQSESRTILDRLNAAGSAVNRAIFENISKPAVGTAIDMTVGLGDLVQRGGRYLGNLAGMDTGEFTPAAPRVKEALGVEDYDPYAAGSMAAQILPFATAGRAATTAAGALDSMFPSLGRESGAYVAGETAAEIARNTVPGSTAAEMLANVVGGTLGANVSGLPPVSAIDDPVLPGEADEPPPGVAAQLLDDLEDAADVSVARLARNETQAIDAAVKSRGRRRTLKTEARRIKNNYLQEDGWAPLEVAGVKDNKPRFKKIAYGFENAPEGVDPLTWSSRLSDNIVSEVDGVVERARAGDEAAIGILRQANWYRSMRDQLRSEFGGIGDVFADVLGTTSAQTNVEQNFRNAVQILRRYSRGEFDAELQAYENRIKQGLPVDGKTLTALHNNGEFPLITSSSGKLFNTNSPSSMGALLNMFRSVKTGSAPKTPNFTGNLIGLTNEATIDVWAARMLRRLSGQSRIAPVAEQGVKGDHLAGSTLENPLVGSEFGFGQEVFRNAADRINASGGVRSIVPEMGDLGPDDLQAVAWFMEKERWTDAGWTTKAGEGGSLDYEMSLAGSPEQVKINDLRRELNTGFKAPKKRKRETEAEHAERVAQARRVYDNRQEFAGIELRALQAPLQRYTIGVSGEIRNRKGVPDKLMSNYEQAEFAAEYDDVVRNDPAVLGYNLANTYGSFMGATERSLNGEFVVRENFDPSALIRRMVEQGKFYDQDAVFISKSVPAGAPNARPGVEIFYKKEVTPEALAKVTESLRAHGIDGFTYITDMRFDDKVNRQARSGARETASLTGLRFQYIPEFDENFDPARADEIYREKANLFKDVLADLIANENVSDVRFNFYDTQVFFRDGYDDYLTRTAGGGSNQAGGELPSGAGPAQPNNGGRAGAELRQPVPDGLGQAPGSGIPQLKKGGAVTSSRRMLDSLIGKKPEGQRVDASGLQRFAKGGEVSSSPTPRELLAQIDRSTANSPATAYGTASSAPDREVTESRNMLMRISDAFGKNVTAPVTGAALDMTAGVGDLLQMGAKAGAKRLGIETKPFTPVSSAVQESLGVAGYNPYSPAALAASVLLPAAGPLRAAGAATRPMMSMAVPGSAKETLSRLAPILDREASVAASAELAAMGARELAPDNVTAEIAAAVAGGGAYNTLDNILSSSSRGPTTSGIIKERGGNWLGEGIDSEMQMLRAKNQGSLSNYPAVLLDQMYRRYTPEAIASLSPESARVVTASIDLLKGKASIDKWIDTKLSKYIRNEMGTESDPIRALAERGVLHVDPDPIGLNRWRADTARLEAGMPGLAQSDAAKAWEDATDVSVKRDTAGNLLDPTIYDSEFVTKTAQERMRQEFLDENPWLTKVAPETNVYDLSRPRGHAQRAIAHLGFEHIIDELNNATRPDTDLPERLRIDYNKLDRMSVPQIVEKVADINKYRAELKTVADLARAQNAATVPFKAYDTVPFTSEPNKRGLGWVELRKPEDQQDLLGSLSSEGAYAKDEAYEQLRDALKYEGDTMGHCVGGYCADVASGATRIYSLRDAKGQPHVTIEVAPVVNGISGEILNEMEPGIWDKVVADKGHYDSYAWLEKNRPDLLARLDARPTQEIVQIKGKGNKAPVAEYLPFVQDFVKSGSWADVGDLGNTGLLEIDVDSDLAKSLTQKGIAVPAYATQQEISSLLRQAQVGVYSDWRRSGTRIMAEPPPEEFAVGGAVTKNNVERVARNDNRKYL